jgi:hypothetical protein
MKKTALLFVLLASTFWVRAQTGRCTSGDCVNGYGTYVWDSYVGDKTYTGNWKNGKQNGMGKYDFIEKHRKGGGHDFESYEGNWKDNQYDGFGTYKKGKLYIKKDDITYNKIEIYDGSFLNGRYSGFGVYTYQTGSKNNEILPDAQKYEGNWVNGYKDGKGKSYNNFVNDRNFFESWSLFDGFWQDDKRHGLGILYENNGTVTKGKWENNKRIETYETYNSNAGKFTGKLKDGKKYGKGQYYLQDGTIIEGNFVDDKLDGTGKITYLDGSVYEGEIKDYKASGYGKTTLYGNYHKGNYLNGLKHGTGAYVQTNGQTFEGEWSNGIQMSGKYYQQGKLIFEGNREDYIADIEKNHAEFKKHLTERRNVTNAENEAKKNAEEIRQSNMSEEEKLIEKYPCAFCSAKGTIPCPGGGKSKDTKVVGTNTYGNMTITEVVETTTTSPSLQCPCNWCNGKKYLKL